jgi:hypothetical protein
MTVLRFRVTGTSTSIERVLERLADLDGVVRAEQVADLMPHLDDDDSSSAGLAENQGTDIGALEIEVEDDDGAVLVRRVAELEAREAGAMLELVDGF